MIDFEDFVPNMMDSGGLFRSPTMEEMSATVHRANQWVAQNNVEVVNVETVVLPNIHNAGEEGSNDASLRTPGEVQSTWHQFMRVWYKR